MVKAAAARIGAVIAADLAQRHDTAVTPVELIRDAVNRSDEIGRYRLLVIVLQCE